jgi:hypothetical protein
MQNRKLSIHYAIDQLERRRLLSSPFAQFLEFGVESVGRGDINGDGAVDQVSVDNEATIGTVIRPYLNDGTGTFVAGIEVIVRPEFFASAEVLVGDIDNDGDDDVLMGGIFPAPGDGYRLYKILNTGGVLGPVVSISADDFGFLELLADIDEDGLTDLVTRTRFGQSHSILWGSGGGTFGDDGITVVNSGATVTTVKKLDVDGDSDLDLVTHSFASGNSRVSVFTQNGPRSFVRVNSTMGVSSGASGPNAFQVFDLNQDQRADLIGATASGLSIRLSLANGTFAAATTIAVDGGAGQWVVCDDFDGDSRPDLLAGGVNSSVLFKLNASNQFVPDATLLQNGGFIATADLDGDGDKDLLDGAGGRVLNDGSGRFGLATSLGSSFSNSIPSWIVADLDRDGVDDLAQKNSAVWLRGLGNGRFSNPIFSQSSFGLAIAELNGDGWLDLVGFNLVGFGNSSQITIAFGTGPAAWASPVSIGSTRSGQPERAYVEQFAGDSKLDIIVDFSGEPLPFLYRQNSTAGIFTESAVANSPFTITAVGDLNSDGLADLIGPTGGRAAYSLGNSSGSFSSVFFASQDTPNAVSLRVADEDGDNDLDILAVTSSLDILIYKNANNASSWTDFLAGSLEPGTPIVVPPVSDPTFAYADADLDGFADLLFPTTYGIAYFAGTGTGLLGAQEAIRLSTSDTSWITNFADVDRNGTIDGVGRGIALAAKKNTSALPPVVLAQELEVDQGPLQIRVQFANVDPTTISAADLAVSRTSPDGGPVNVPATSVQFDPATGWATFTLGSSLPNGDYRATIGATNIAGTSGMTLQADFQFDFFSLVGDLNRDRRVDFTDLLTLVQNYGIPGRTFAEGDIDNDTQVDFTDLLILVQNYNVNLVRNTSFDRQIRHRELLQ